MMGWMQRLYETYGYLEQTDALDGSNPLLPICHTTQKAQIEVTLSGDGEFLHARPLKADESTTIIPCTIDSAARSGKTPPPHPLHDKLQYVAGDYVEFGGDAAKHFYHSYLSLLKEWCDFEGSAPQIHAVYEYIKKGCLMRDLTNHGFEFIKASGNTSQEDSDQMDESDDSTPVNTDGPLSIDSFVRFAVSIPGMIDSELWNMPSIQRNYIQFYQSHLDIPQLCYVSGMIAPRMEKHPKKILPYCTGAKLISLKDEGYKYHGRFTDMHQPISVSYEVSQKAHNALCWLIAKQGRVTGEQVILAWEIHGQKIPSPMSDYPFDMEDEPSRPETAAEYSMQLGRATAGYYQKAVVGSDNNDSTVIIMGLDAASTGRASITYYQEISGNDYLQRLRKWYESCSWKLLRYDKRENKYVRVVSTPSPHDIIQAMYGRLDSKSATRTRKTINNRLLPCIVENRPLPYDLVQTAFRRVVNPMSFKNNGKWDETGWEAAMATTCALVRKYYKEGSSDMVLDENRTDRNYLYGRLLALAEKVEKDVLREENVDRSTNAMRYMQVYQQRPNETWMKLFVHLLPPYFAKLGGKAEFYKWKINQIVSQFEPGDFTLRRPLDGRFLEGYHCQMQALYTKKELEQANDEEKE